MEQLQKLIDGVQSGDPTSLGIAGGAVGVVLILMVTLARRGKKRRKAVA